MHKRTRSLVAALGFLLPNFIGFLTFTLFPVLFSFWMAFTNWSLKPAVAFEFVGLRNMIELLGVRPISESHAGLLWVYVLSALSVWAGLVGALWANFEEWRGVKIGGVILTFIGISTVVLAKGQGVMVAGIIAIVCGIAVMNREEDDWRFGRGTLPVLLVLIGALGLWRLHQPIWDTYEVIDHRFWEYFYNTVFLMLGIPFSIVGSLGLALLVNEELPLAKLKTRMVGALICLGCGMLTLIVVWGLGKPNIAVLGTIFWGIAALGLAFNVVTFRTIYYLPTFTAGVALMILWKALYNSETGPINMGLAAMFDTFGWNAEPPKWLASVAWAKPALIIMGVWISIGGTNMLLYLAGLSNIPQELLEAAEVDGAGAWHRLRHIIWPQLAPTTFFISIMSIIGGLQGGFEQARVMTGGGPAGSTTTLSYYIYNKAFQDLDLGYASAISWILFTVIFIATALNWRFGKDLDVGQ